MPRRKNKDETNNLSEIVTLHVTDYMLKHIDNLVEEGYVHNRSEGIRQAIELIIESNLSKAEIDAKKSQTSNNEEISSY
jgi:Arc/MetJ-type ribon-helix-helix transcriptional regulator